jgi:hypothetical protein
MIRKRDRRMRVHICAPVFCPDPKKYGAPLRVYIETPKKFIGIALRPKARFATLSGKPKWVLMND